MGILCLIGEKRRGKIDYDIKINWNRERNDMDFYYTDIVNSIWQQGIHKLLEAFDSREIEPVLNNDSKFLPS